MQKFETSMGRATMFALWVLIAGAAMFMAGLLYVAKDLLGGEVTQPERNYQYQTADPTLKTRRAEYQRKHPENEAELRDYERLKADAEHHLAYLSWKEANANVQVADAGVDVTRYAAKISVLGAIIAGVGTVLSAIAAGVAVLAFSESRRATLTALASHSDDRRGQRAFLSVRLGTGPAGDQLEVRNVGAMPARLARMQPGSVPTLSPPSTLATNLRIGSELADLLGPGAESVISALAPAPLPSEDRVFEIAFDDGYGLSRRLQVRFGDGPFAFRRRSQNEIPI